MNNLNPLYLTEMTLRQFGRKINPINAGKLKRAKQARRIADDIRTRLPEYDTANSSEIYRTGKIRATRQVPGSSMNETLHGSVPSGGRDLSDTTYLYRSRDMDGLPFGRETTQNITGPIRRVKK